MINFEKQFDNIESKFKDIENNLNNQIDLDTEKLIKLNKEYAELTPIVETIKKYKSDKVEISELSKLINDTDPSIKELAETELKEKKKSIINLENELMKLLIPKDENDKKNSILEIRAGTGGDEASLFAADLFSMYQKFSDINNWKFEILSISETGLKGIKEVICNISGYNVFSKLKFESGVHRVQRVPSTESSGRVHTSAATVAVLPEAEEVDINIEDKDLRIDVFRSSGPGGQSVNTTDSAVRITHIPSGIVVSQQDEKSQHKNKAKALKILRSRILDNEIKEKNQKRSLERKSQVGSGDRSERIRTYNFPQGRVSDHRINLTLYNLTEVLEGNLDDLINPLITDEETNKLAELDNE
ncbi:MAG: peptide chain release factor 1 [Alphaproteobacteria bacterium]|nr:peptide chain release factor 1 [Alphaproteobacteria bacterium]